MKDQFERIIRNILISMQYFERDDCSWGLGLAYFHSYIILQKRCEIIDLCSKKKQDSFLIEA